MWTAIAVLFPVAVLYLHGWGPYAPVYWGGAAVIAAGLTVWCVRPQRFQPPPKSYFVLVVLTVYLLVSDFVRGNGISPNAGNLALGVSAALLVFMSPAAERGRTPILWGVVVALALMGVDRVVQFTPYGLPFYEDGVPDAGAWYYQYKATYLAGDANSIGLFLIPLFALLRGAHRRSSGLTTPAEYALQVMTFSKASIAAVVIRDLVSRRMSMLKRVVGAAALLAVCTYVVYAGVDVQRYTDSGAIKIQTLQVFLRVIEREDFATLLWGAGNNTALNALGIYLHAWPLTAVYETGLVGLFLLTLYLVCAAFESPSTFRAIHVPVFLVAGWSFLFYLGAAWLYLPQYVLQRIESEERAVARRGKLRSATRDVPPGDQQCARTDPSTRRYGGPTVRCGCARRDLDQ
jgi:hypothetical protein